VHTTPAFPELLRLIDDRSATFRAVIATAPRFDLPVPTCPGWTLADLVQHIGAGRRSWAATVAAGPDAPGRVKVEDVAPLEREALLVWLADSSQQMIDALLQAGPERGCWSWWDGSQSPLTCGAVARHQLQEIAVHTYDAQLTVGAPEPLPEAVALDGVEEFLFTCCSTTTSAWPHEPAVVDYHATEGRSWRQWLSADGSRITAPDASPADVSVTGPASELELFLYGRLPVDGLKLDGKGEIFDQLDAWEW
jgi:uncharacterized protein (TIGR03083 family)